MMTQEQSDQRVRNIIEGNNQSNSIPPPPAGFDTEVTPQNNAGSSIPPPPAGFTQEVTPQDNYFVDAAKNVIPDVVHLAVGLGEQVKEGAYEMPKRALQTGLQMASGTPYAETPSGKYDTQFFQNVPDLASSMAQPYAHPIDSFRSQPVTTALAWAPLFGGARALAKTGAEHFATAEPNFLERMGARGVNRSIGVDPTTVKEMTPYQQNPARFGVNLGRQLGKEGFEGKGAYDAADIGQSNYNEAGVKVKNSLNDIRKANSELGVYPELEDSLKKDANVILKPLLDRANELRQSKFPLRQLEEKYHRAAYEGLAEKANANNGFITLDDIEAVRQDLGEQMGMAGEESRGILSKVYRKLRTTEDAMIEDIASSTHRPELAKNLRDANSKFSRYADILPDIKKAASKTSSVKSSAFLKHPWDKTVDALDPKISQLFGKAGRGLRSGAEMADKATAFPGKAASSLFNKGKQMAGDTRGSIFPTKQPKTMFAEAPTKVPLRDLPDSEQAYQTWKQSYDRHMENNDFSNALKDKWGMLKNQGGSDLETAAPTPKMLTSEKAREFLKKTKGNKDKARALAREEGWTF